MNTGHRPIMPSVWVAPDKCEKYKALTINIGNANKEKAKLLSYEKLDVQKYQGHRYTQRFHK